MPLCWLPVPDMYTDSGSSEMWCAAILKVQHTHVWAAVWKLSLMLSHSLSSESPSEVVLVVFWVIRCHAIVLVACPRHVHTDMYIQTLAAVRCGVLPS